MQSADFLKILLLVLLIVCAVAVNLTRSLLKAVVIFMSYSSIMCLLWILMESPDLAITEAAVGAGVTSLLMFAALKKIHAVRSVNLTKHDEEEKSDESGNNREAQALHGRGL